jgi:hypothetical protein
MDGEPLHWAKDGGGQRFNARMRALREQGAQHLTPEFILTFLEGDRPLEKLSDTRLNEAQALARLDFLAEVEHESEL